MLFIEAGRAPRSGRLTLTGGLGDVTRESRAAAISLLRARASTLIISLELFGTVHIHVDVAACAISKDGRPPAY